MRWLVALACTAAVVATDARHEASAQWCAQYDDYTYTCGFSTFSQCLDTVRGVGGLCRRDYYASAPRAPAGRQPDTPAQGNRARQEGNCQSMTARNC